MLGASHFSYLGGYPMTGSPAEITLYDVLGQQWRCGKDADGTPWAVAADVAKSFDYRDARDALRMLDDDEKGTRKVRTPGGPQQMKVVFEDGLWELIFRSTKPEAKAIKKRVKAILREIRETGSFIPETLPPALRIRLDEKYNYFRLRDFLAASSDYDPEDKYCRMKFAEMQNMLYEKFVGMDAKRIKRAREVNPSLLEVLRRDGTPYKKDLDVAKNYLTRDELDLINHVVLAALARLGIEIISSKRLWTMREMLVTLLDVMRDMPGRGTPSAHRHLRAC